MKHADVTSRVKVDSNFTTMPNLNPNSPSNIEQVTTLKLLID
jgi:hypothetical protein